MIYELGRIAQWDGHIRREYVHADDAAKRDELADAARVGNWQRVLSVVTLAAGPHSLNHGWINAVRLDGNRRYAPLHQAAWHGASIDTVAALLSCGAWRTLRNRDGKRPLDIAQERGHYHLTRILQPEIKQHVPSEVVAGLQRNLHALIHRYDRDAPTYLRLPDVEVLTELDPPAYWIRVSGGIFIIELRSCELNLQAVGKTDYSTPAPFRTTVDRIHEPK
ncbi:hypothetical protein ABZ935_05300 [Streptomyces coeruleorubidus]|uniref:hypothetical protein n=1 Tax=Streptomyces coeruleorubidus TaxID=116188 RepID=UPI0033FD05DC